METTEESKPEDHVKKEGLKNGAGILVGLWFAYAALRKTTPVSIFWIAVFALTIVPLLIISGLRFLGKNRDCSKITENFSPQRRRERRDRISQWKMIKTFT